MGSCCSTEVLKPQAFDPGSLVPSPKSQPQACGSHLPGLSNVWETLREDSCLCHINSRAPPHPQPGVAFPPLKESKSSSHVYLPPP